MRLSLSCPPRPTTEAAVPGERGEGRLWYEAGSGIAPHPRPLSPKGRGEEE